MVTGVIAGERFGKKFDRREEWTNEPEKGYIDELPMKSFRVLCRKLRTLSCPI